MSTPITDLAAILAPRPVVGLPIKTTMAVRRARGVVHSISATTGQVMVSVGHSTASLAVPATVPQHVSLTVGQVVTIEMFGTRVVVSGVVTRGNRVKTVTAAYTMSMADYCVLAGGTTAYTVTLPPVSPGVVVIVKRIGTGTITVAPASGTIDGAASVALGTQYMAMTLACDGTNWWVTGQVSTTIL